MKKNPISLEDRNVCFFLQRLGDRLRDSKIKYALTNGVAEQLLAVSMACKEEEKALEDILLADGGFKPNLRGADCVNIILEEGERPSSITKALVGETIIGDNFFNIDLIQGGAGSLFYGVESFRGDKIVELKIAQPSRGLVGVLIEDPKYLLNNARNLGFKYDGRIAPRVKVLNPEQLIASKLIDGTPFCGRDVWALADLSLRYRKFLNVGKIGMTLGLNEDGSGLFSPISQTAREKFEDFKSKYEARMAGSE